MLSLSEPHPLKELQRIGWIKFKAGTDVEAALTALTEPETEDFQATTAAHRPTRARYTHEIANSGTRIRADYELALAIAKVCDQSLNDAVEGETDAPIYDGVSLVEARLKDHILAPIDTPMDDAEQEDPAQATIRRANEVNIWFYA